MVNATSVTVTGQAITGTQGQSFTGEVATFTDLNLGTTPASYQAWISWGDGNSSAGTVAANGGSGFIVTGTDLFAAAGALVDTVTVLDPSGATAQATSTATVAGVAAAASSFTPVQGTSGTWTVATFTNSLSSTDSYSAYIDWGSGTESPASVTGPTAGVYGVSGTYTFPAGGTFPVSVTVVDNTDGLIASVSSNVVVAGPSDVSIGGESTAAEGASYTLYLSDEETGTNTISSWTITWAPGDVQTVTGDPGYVTHTFGSGVASSTITATATDASGAYAADTSQAITLTPESPTGVNAVWNDDGSATVSWTDESSIASSITVSYSSDGGSTWSTPADLSASSTSDTITGLSDSASYLFDVSDLNSTTGSSATTTASLSNTPLQMPSTPTYTFGSDGTSITLTWSEASDDRTNFQIEKQDDDDSGANFKWYSTLGATVTTTTITGLIPGDDYSFRVRSIAPGESEYSGAIDVTMPEPGAPDAPVLAPITQPDDTPIWFTMTWTDDDDWEVSQYVVQFKEVDQTTVAYSTWTVALGTYSETADEFTPSQIYIGQTLKYRVIAIGSDGASSAPSNTETAAQTGAQPDSVQNFTASWASGSNATDGGTINLSWTFDQGANPGFTQFDWTLVQNGVSYPDQFTSLTTEDDEPGEDGTIICTGTLSTVGVEDGDTVPTQPFAIEVSSQATEEYPGLVWPSISNAAVKWMSPLPGSTPGTTTDTSKPNTPENLSARVASAYTVELEWDNDSDNETSFTVQRKLSTDSDCMWENVGSGDATTGTDDTSYTDTVTDPTLIYDYRVYASNAVGDSGYSTPIAIGPLAIRLAWTTEEDDSNLEAFFVPLMGGEVTPVPDSSGSTDFGNPAVTVNWSDDDPSTDGSQSHFFEFGGETPVTLTTGGSLSWFDVNVTYAYPQSDSLPDATASYEEISDSGDETNPTSSLSASTATAFIATPSSAGDASTSPPRLVTVIGDIEPDDISQELARLLEKAKARSSADDVVFVGLYDVKIFGVPVLGRTVASGSTNVVRVDHVLKDGAGNWASGGGYAGAKAMIQSFANSERCTVQDDGQGNLTTTLQDGTIVSVKKDGTWANLIVQRVDEASITVRYYGDVRQLGINYPTPQGIFGGASNLDLIKNMDTIVEDKNGTGLLGPLNTNTVTQWALDQIYDSTEKRIAAIQNATRTAKDPGYEGPDTPPSISDVQGIKHFEFDIKGNWPALEAAVNAQIQELEADFAGTGYTFSVRFGVP